MENMKEQFVQALRAGVVPATGCTEPVAIALAAAKAMEYVDEKIAEILVEVSPNVMKNALAVMVPGTGEPGLLIAAAAGAIAGDATAGLSVIADVPANKVDEIKQLAHSGKVRAKVALVPDDLFVQVTIKTVAKNTIVVAIAGGHTNIYLVRKNEQYIVKEKRPAAHQVSKNSTFLRQCHFKDIWNFAVEVDCAEITFMQKAGDLNMALAREGLEKDYGISLGDSLKEAAKNDLSNKIIAYAAAASDARMGGAQLPAMSNSGSGNQGITATVPVCVLAENMAVSSEKLTRALTLSHLTALYIHSFLPVLSAFCATASAAMGAAAGSIYLKTGSYQQACNAIKNMCGDAVGMVCDGAGCSCAMKVATSVSAMTRAVNLALNGVTIPASNGLVCEDIDKTLHGIGDLATIGLKETDKVILETMLNK